MANMMFIHTKDGKEHEIRFERDMVKVESWTPTLDPNWRYTDKKGHSHQMTSARGFANTYPTLIWVVTGQSGCDPECCGETWDVGEYRCRKCSETIVPGTRISFPQLIVAGERYYIDGELATREQIVEFMKTVVE